MDRDKSNERYRRHLKVGLKTKAQFTEDNEWYHCEIIDLLEDGGIEVKYSPPYGNM